MKLVILLLIKGIILTAPTMLFACEECQVIRNTLSKWGENPQLQINISGLLQQHVSGISKIDSEL